MTKGTIWANFYLLRLATIFNRIIIINMLLRQTRKFSNFTNHFRTAVWSIPFPTSKDNNSNNAFLFNDRLLAIANGMPGWQKIGVDPSKFPQELMQNIQKSTSSLPDNLKLHPQAILRDAIKNTKEPGSSTCTLAVFDPVEPKLYTANIGNSGFFIYRRVDDDVNLVFRSKDLTHGFNAPYLVGTDGDNPDSANYESVEIQNKDLIVMYTEGLIQNMFDDQIMRMIKPFLLLHEIPDLEIVAEMLAERASEHSTDEEFQSPYMETARQNRLE